MTDRHDSAALNPHHLGERFALSTAEYRQATTEAAGESTMSVASCAA
jgi:hypothetical protein